MPGRHQIAPTRRFGLRWILGAALAILVAGATALGLAITPANAASAVTATFGVTGVSANNCPVQIGGSDVYVLPGQELDVKSSLVGIEFNGLPLSDVLGQVASFNGNIVIDPKSTHPITLPISTAARKVPALSTGNHSFTWTVTGLTLAGLIPVKLNATLAPSAGGGASLTYSGTIHVTSAAAQCGVSLQVPSVHASVSAPGVPPITIGIPGVTAPTVSIPTSLPSLPGGKSTQPGGGGGSNPGGSNNGGGSGPVQAGVVPVGDNANVYPGAGAGGFNALPLPNILGSNGGTSGLLPVPAKSGAKPATGKQNSAGKNKSIDLASKTSETGQLSVILAIIAVIALTLVAATYARLYVLRKN